MKLKTYHVKLSPETLMEAAEEGREIARAKKLSHLDPKTIEAEKIANSTFGSYAQQLLINEIGARRLTKEEGKLKGFPYDVEGDRQKLLEFCGWGDSFEPEKMDRIARTEIKSVHMDGRKWISFHDEYFAHALTCARMKRFDYLTTFGVRVIDEKEKVAEVSLLGILTPAAFTNPRTYCPSGYQRGQHYLRKNDVHAMGVGRIFI